MLKLSRYSSFAQAATLAGTITVLLGWPSHVDAVGEAEQATQQQAVLAQERAAPRNVTLAQDQAKVGDLLITAILAESEANRGGQVIRLECRNPTEHQIVGKVQLELTRTTGNSMARVMPRPQVAWRHPEDVVVEPGQTLTREVPLPKNIGAEVARIERARKRAETSETAAYPSVYFGVVAEPVEAAATRAKAQRRSSTSKLSMLPPTLSRPDFGF